jgi:hypothetical protein
VKKLIQELLEKEPIDVKITLNTGKSFSQEMFNKELLKLYKNYKMKASSRFLLLENLFPILIY